MRADLHAAGRCLGWFQRAVLREQLRRAQSLLSESETVRVLAPAWWRGHRAVAVATTTRLLLVRQERKCSSLSQLSMPLRALTRLDVHPAPPQGARFRVVIGVAWEEFSVTGCSTELEAALRSAPV